MKYKQIEGYEGRYLLGEDGTIVSCHTGKERPPHKNRGYLYITLNKDGIKSSKKVHRLVAEAFIPNPKNKPHVNHKDGDKENNHHSNLEWCTPAENQKHAQQHGLLGSVGEAHHKTKLTETCVAFIKFWLSQGYGPTEIAKRFDCTPLAVSHIKAGRSWRNTEI